MKKRSKLRAAGLAAGSLLAAVLLAEVLIRAFVPARYWQFWTTSADWQSDPELGWANKPNLDLLMWEEGGAQIRFRTNPDGLQPAEATRARVPGKRRIMIFGDSTVVGRAVPEERRLAAQMETALAARGVRAEVLSAGVRGYSTDQELLLMKRLVPRYRPDVVLLVVCNIDFARNQADRYDDMPKPRFTVGPSGDLQFARPPYLVDPTEKRGFIESVGRAAVVMAARGAFRVVARRLGTAFASENKDAALLAHIDWRLFDAMLEEMKRVCARSGAALAVTEHPSADKEWLDAQLQAEIQKRAARLGLGFCDLIDTFAAHRSEGPFFIPPANAHCNAKGYALSAGRLAEFLTRE